VSTKHLPNKNRQQAHKILCVDKANLPQSSKKSQQNSQNHQCLMSFECHCCWWQLSIARNRCCLQC